MDRFWFSGLNNFRKHSLNKHDFVTELLDTETDINRDVSEIFYDHIKNRQTKYVELLYSGGIDSETVLIELMKVKVPIIAVTMVIKIKNIIVNSHDLYYSEKFCREYGITHKLIDFNAEPFYENGDYLSYLTPYRINEPHVASHFWLLEKCDYFPIIGGDWPWVQLHKEKKVLSPFKNDFSMYQAFMIDRNINGIDNMLCYSLDSSLKFMSLQKESFLGDEPVSLLKERMYKKINSNILGRIRSYGWEISKILNFNLSKYAIELIKQNKTLNNKIIWGDKISDFLKTPLKENNLFY